MSTVVSARFLIRRGTAADLASVNEIPLQGEFVYELDEGLTDGKYRIKIGDGVSHYNALPYISLGADQVRQIMPVVTGDVPPVLVYLDDGSLVHTEIN
jgi:hypothetical protein